AYNNEDNKNQLSKIKSHLCNFFFNNVDDLAIIFIDTNGIIQVWNSGAEKLLQYSQNEIIGKHFSITYQKDSIETKYPDYVIEKVKEVGKFEHEGWRKKKDNTVFWAKSKTSSVFDEKGILLGYLKIIQNLNEAKNSFEGEKVSENRYKMLVNSVSDYAIFLLDEHGKISTWNSGAEKILGYKKEEVLNKDFSMFYADKDQDANFPQLVLEKAKEEGKFHFEAWRKRKNGSLFWTSTIVNSIKDCNHQILGFSNVTRDLTSKKTAESDLWESEEKYRILVEGVHDYAIIMLDTFGYIKSWNNGAEKLHGYKTEEIIGKHFSIFYTSDSIENKFPEFELEKAVKDGKFEHEGVRMRKDNSTFWTNVIISPLYDERGNHIGFSKIARDLTFGKRIGDELNNKNKELSKINADLDNFIYSVSHDLRVPISNLEGLIDAISITLPESCKEHVSEMFLYTKKSINNLKEVIKDLSEIGRIQKEENIEVVKIIFSELVEEFKFFHKNQIEEANAIIKCDFKIEEIYFSKKNLRSILQNLLINAINYRSPNIQAEIWIKTFREKNYICLSVSDNGMGIKQEYLSRIFEMFKRIYTHVEGTGIGLYIVKRIMDNVEGKIEVTSKVREGTTFKLYFPYLKS
ncbi:MAG: PAS domain-containing sensor histidine kinase, partial [Bacteroidota bacterium]|nr:PAS domain-containing sensor histidine kinase [Bacteroidota bacterium]